MVPPDDARPYHKSKGLAVTPSYDTYWPLFKSIDLGVKYVFLKELLVCPTCTSDAVRKTMYARRIMYLDYEIISDFKESVKNKVFVMFSEISRLLFMFPSLNQSLNKEDYGQK
jgi:hypothetical protein